ncbi:MAG: DUF4340 domain-containing protein [Phycisphaerae bacterium]|nr:DUF4340 domain-containing protein [Phycisphaerae bacterium]
MLDVLKQNAYVSTSAIPGVVQVSSSTLDSVKKSPLDLRDKNVLSVDPSAISSITIHAQLPATTQPTTRPASDTTIRLQHESFDMSEPTTAPSTAPATLPATEPTSKPTSKPVMKWMMVSRKPEISATDSKVNAVFTALHPLKVQRYQAVPTTLPATTDHYTLTLEAAAPMTNNYTIELFDPGNGQPVIGRYNGLTFELDRGLLDALKADFLKPDEPTPANIPTGLTGGLAPG